MYAADLRRVARHELAPRGAGRDIAPPDTHQPWSRRGAADLEQLEQAFAAIGEAGALFFAGLVAAQRRFAGYHARQILLLGERYTTSDLGAALLHASSFGAFERSSASSPRAPPHGASPNTSPRRRRAGSAAAS